MYVILAAFKHENKNVWLSAFSNASEGLKKINAMLFLTYDYTSYMARRTRVRKDSRVSLVEFATVVTSKDLTLPMRSSLMFAHSNNQSDFLGPFVTPAASDEWQLPVHEKRKFLFGDTRKDSL